jgi:hypothetical protein
MPLVTNGFESLQQLQRHFSEHGDDFRAGTYVEYEQMADQFMGGDKPETVYECLRRCGAKLRYDPANEAFGVLDAGGIIRTYYKPVPCSSLPLNERDSRKLSGRCHQYPNNLIYFKRECEK